MILDTNILPLVLRKDGSVPLTGNWDVGGYDITNIGTLSADKLVVDTTTLVVNAASYEDRVGIGTATPSNPLTVAGPLGDGDQDMPFKFIRNTPTTDSDLSSFLGLVKTTGDMTDGFGSRYQFRIEDDTSGEKHIGSIGFVRDGTDDQGKFFVTTGNDAASTAKLVVEHGGEVGIGEITPTAWLHVKTTGAGDIAYFQTTSTSADLYLKYGYLGVGFYWKYVGSGSGNDNALELWTEGAGAADDQVYRVWQDGNIAFVQSVRAGGVGAPTNALSMDTASKIDFRDNAIGIYSQADTFMDLFADGGIRLGDSSAGAPTNYAQFSATGDLTFVGTAGLPYGEIYAKDVSDTITIAGIAEANKVQITSFSIDGTSNNANPDHTNDHITITTAGHYLCTVSLAVESTGGGGADTFEFAVFKNNGATEFPNVHGHRRLVGGGGDAGSVSLSGIIDLAAPVVNTDTSYAFVDSNPDTITDSNSQFVADGFAIGQTITVSGSTSNDGDYTIATVVAGTITLIAADTLTAEAAGDTVTLTGSETIELWCWNDDSTDDVVIDDVTLSLIQIGGT